MNRTLLVAALAAAAAASGIFVGYRLATGNPEAAAPQAHAEVTRPSAPSRQVALPKAPATARGDRARETVLDPTPLPQEYRDALSGHRLEKRHSEVSAAFPPSDAGRALTRAVVLQAFRATHGTEGRLLEESLSLLRQHPGEAFADLRAGLRKLSDSYSDERQFLVQFASRLEVDRSKRLELLTEELARPVRAAGQDSQAAAIAALSPVTALDSLLEVTGDTKALEPLIRDALKAHREKGTPKESQEALLSRYAGMDPERARRLREELGL